MFLIDTNVAIHLRDAEPVITDRIDRLSASPSLSLMSWVELEGGVAADPANAAARRRNTDILLRSIAVLPIDAHVVERYGAIVHALGFSRRLVLDRLIAATAIVAGMTLITMNPADFRDIPDLKLEIWPAPPQ